MGVEVEERVKGDESGVVRDVVSDERRTAHVPAQQQRGSPSSDEGE